MKMEKKMLFLCNQNSFMVTAIVNNLKKEGFDVEQLPPDVTELSHMEALPKVFLMYLDDDEEGKFRDSCVYLRDRLIEQPGEFLLYMIGTPEELERQYENIPREYVSSTFDRPINVKELVAKVSEDMEEEGKKERRNVILVVDDDPTMLNTLKAWLSDKYLTYMANSGMNAISLLARHKVDLILLDYEMPVVTGAKVLEMIRSESSTSDIPVMFLTAKGDREHVMEVLALKPVKYLLKTMPREEILEQIEEFFENKKKEEMGY